MDPAAVGGAGAPPDPLLDPPLKSFLSSHGIHLWLSSPYTSPQNGKVECFLRTLSNITLTILIHARKPVPYYAEALVAAMYFLNRRPCSAVRHSIPYQLLYTKQPK